MFTPVKSASLLWALAGTEVRQLVEQAHHAAVSSTVGWIEQHAAFTRTGRNGVAQVDTTGLVCAAFDHRESRAADPDLLGQGNWYLPSWLNWLPELHVEGDPETKAPPADVPAPVPV